MKHLFLALAIFSFIFTACQKTQEDNDEGESYLYEAVFPMETESFETIQLQKPDTLGGIPLMKAIQHRKSERVFKKEVLTIKDVSEILWVAYGINRPDEEKRTVPSGLALYPLEIYTVFPNGIYHYDPIQNALIPVVEGDYRYATGDQPFVETAPLNLVIIANYNKYDGELKMPQERRLIVSAIDAGHVSQNVYLYCTSEGMRVAVRDARQEKEKELLDILNLDKNYKFLLTLTIGY